MKIFKKKRVVGIAFHDYSAQVVEVKATGKGVCLQSYNRTLIPPNIINNGEILKPEELKPLLKNLLASSNPRPITCKSIAVVFPSTKLFHHIFEFPPNLKKEEIYQALPFEAEKFIPFSIQDVYWDFKILPDRKNVLFVAIEKRIADKYVSLLQSMDFSPFILGVDVETLQYGLREQIIQKKNCLIIDVGTLSSNYLVVSGNAVKQFFSSTRGGKHLIKSLVEEFQVPEKEILLMKEKNTFENKYLPKIQSFIEDSYEFAQEPIGKNNIKDIYLTGEFLNLPGFYEMAKKAFRNKNIYIGDPRKSLCINAKNFKMISTDENSSYYSTHFTNAIGIAIQGAENKKEAGINILPDSLKEDAKSKKREFLIVITSILMSAILLFLATFSFFKHQDFIYKRRILEIEKSSVDKVLYGTRYQEILTAIKSFNREVSEIFEIEKSLFSVPHLLEDIKNLLGDGVTLSKMHFKDEDLSVEILGVAKNREELLATVQAFQEAEFISEVITPLSAYDLRANISFTMKLNLIFKELTPYGEKTNF